MTGYPKRILVLDADDQYRKLLVELLAAKDYVVLLAQDKSAAERMLNQYEIDLVIEDAGKYGQLISQGLFRHCGGATKRPKHITMSGDPYVLRSLTGQVDGIYVKGLEPVETLLQLVGRILFQ